MTRHFRTAHTSERPYKCSKSLPPFAQRHDVFVLTRAIVPQFGPYTRRTTGPSSVTSASTPASAPPSATTPAAFAARDYSNLKRHMLGGKPPPLAQTK